MNAPRLKKTNTIGIRYLDGVIYDDDMPLILDETLGIEDDEVLGIADLGKNRQIVKLRTKEKYEEICDLFRGKEISVRKNLKI